MKRSKTLKRIWSLLLTLAMVLTMGIAVMPTYAAGSGTATVMYPPAAEGKVTFTVYPKSLSSGSTYYVYLSSSASGREELLRFNYYQSYTLGDVDGDGYPTATDALWVLQNAADNRSFSSTQMLAGDVDHDGYITATDALWILQYAAGNRTEF